MLFKYSREFWIIDILVYVIIAGFAKTIWND